MAPEYTGTGDARRSIELLWGIEPQPKRGPRRGLSVGQVVRAAIEVADVEGLAALSMRRVAERLGIGTMSLYTYVRTKAELLDLMVDAVFGEQVETLRARSGPEGAEGAHAAETAEAAAKTAVAAAKGVGGVEGTRRWRADLERFARAGWDLQLRHPWMLGVAVSRSVLGPNESALFEAALRIVDGLGLSGREMVAVVDLVGTYVRGAVRAASEAVEAPKATGMTDTDWWLEREPILNELEAFQTNRFPTVAKVSAEGGFDVRDEEHEYTLAFALEDFEFGLQRVLDGIEAFVHSERAGAGAAGPSG